MFVMSREQDVATKIKINKKMNGQEAVATWHKELLLEI